MSIDKYEDAKKYFEVLLDIDPYLFSDYSYFKFLKALHLTKYSPELYKAYIEILNHCISNGTNIDYNLISNPFDPDTVPDDIENMYVMLLKKINNCYF
jgi:hypothetical protein